MEAGGRERDTSDGDGLAVEALRRFFASSGARNVLLPLCAAFFALLGGLTTFDEVAAAADGPGFAWSSTPVWASRVLLMAVTLLAAVANTTWGRQWSDKPLRRRRNVTRSRAGE